LRRLGQCVGRQRLGFGVRLGVGFRVGFRVRVGRQRVRPGERMPVGQAFELPTPALAEADLATVAGVLGLE
jgi:hypothetical protein